MSLDPTAADLLSAVRASPRAVAAHDRAAWVELFGTDAVVNDPVGSRPHVGRSAIERFYDTFIGPNTITFQVDHDFISPPTVVRDLMIRIAMSTGATVAVPMHLRYDLAEADGTWKITRLAAHWELAAMVVQLLRTGAPGLGAALKLGPQLVVNQGLGGAAGMMRALFGVGRAGKRAANRILSAAADTDISRVRRLIDHNTVIEMPAGTPVSVEEFTNRVRNMRWDKMIAAGRTVSVSVELGDAHGVVFIEFATGTTRMNTIRVFTDA
ncbi:nuclear transport factor 2 family protein [Nocardia australiensis]|uniref:nuclear transport factor 2 family protein n=1 Tax=Nocardia australiensis TaxID=2887191 RepID=UPI001D146AB8|nr:nuclear transport factor 2 family protein [Nocardia australiensis]